MSLSRHIFRAIKLIEHLIKALENLEEKEIHLYVKCGPILPPWMREIPTVEGNILLDYEYAKNHLKDKELEELRGKYLELSISRQEAIKRGIVFTETLD